MKQIVGLVDRVLLLLLLLGRSWVSRVLLGIAMRRRAIIEHLRESGTVLVSGRRNGCIDIDHPSGVKTVHVHLTAVSDSG